MINLMGKKKKEKKRKRKKGGNPLYMEVIFPFQLCAVLCLSLSAIDDQI